MESVTTVAQLQALLKERNLYPWFATADGVEPVEGFMLYPDQGEWVVVHTARGLIRGMKRFSSEPDAVANLMHRLEVAGLIEIQSK